MLTYRRKTENVVHQTSLSWLSIENLFNFFYYRERVGIWFKICPSLQWKLEGKYSLESTDPRESEIRAPPQLIIALKLSYYLFIIAKLFKVKDGCLKFVYNIKIPGLRRFGQ